MNLFKKFYNFLIPQYSIACVFLASLLILISCIIQAGTSLLNGQIPPGYNPIILIAAGFITYYIFNKLFYKEPNNNDLEFIEVVGIIAVLYISVNYVYQLLIKLNITELTVADYFFLIYASITLLRFILLPILFTFGNKISIRFVSIPTKALKQHIELPLLIAVIIVSLFFYFKNGIYNPAISTGQAFYLGIFCLDIMQMVFKKENKLV